MSEEGKEREERERKKLLEGWETESHDGRFYHTFTIQKRNGIMAIRTYMIY